MKSLNKSKKIIRYIVKANDRVVDWSFSEKKANEIAFRFEYECLNQDEPFAPKMEIVEEVAKMCFLYDIRVLEHVFHGIEADNENEAKMIACDMYYEVTGNSAYTDDCVIIKINEQ